MPNSGFDSFDPRAILIVCKQSHLRAAISLQLAIIENGAADSGLGEAARNFALNPVEAPAASHR
jgi:hypothetical protein